MAANLSLCDGVNDSLHTMVNILCNVHHGFKVFHCNARSLSGTNLDIVRHMFVNSLVDVLCVSETWFHTTTPDSLIEIDGYELFRNDRAGKRGGGVAIYCKSNLRARLINVSTDSHVEYLSIEIPGNIKVLISCVYNPHRNYSLDSFFDNLSTLIVDYEFYVICGDFNVNLLCEDSVSKAFCDLVSSAGLEMVHNGVPTRFGNNVEPSLLDLFLVSDRRSIVKFDQIDFITDHDLIFVCLDLPINVIPSSEQFWVRDFDNINFELLCKDLSSIMWSFCWSLVTVNEKLDWLTNVISDLYETYVPLKLVIPRQKSVPWFTGDILNALKLRNRSRSKWKRNPSMDNWREFVILRKHANLKIRQAKRNYFESKLNSSHSTKQIWKNIRKLKIYSTESRICSLDPNALNNYFSAVSHPNLSTQEIVSCSVEHTFEFNAVTEVDVLLRLNGITSQAVGSDCLSLRFIKLILPYILPSLTHIINHCIAASSFPDSWKIAIITPIPKKSNATLDSDYRPISILPSLAKVFEKILADQLNKYLNANLLLSPLQSGFRAGLSCETAMLKILDDIRTPFDKNWLTCLCLLDFSKAFDSVNHSLLCQKLEYWFHLGKPAVKLISSFLYNRKQLVRVGILSSDLVDVGAGVPQGSILGPLLFVMFINDLFHINLSSTLHAYADDVQLYLSDEMCRCVDLVSTLNYDLVKISTWASENGLTLNANKCCVLPICYKRLDLDVLPSVFIGNVSIKKVSKIKNLGFVINSKLSCIDHVNLVVSRVFNILRCLRASRNFIPLSIRRNLILQLIMPHFNYFCNVYSKMDATCNNKIRIAFNNAVRFVYLLRRSDHIHHREKTILGVGILQYFEIRNIIYLRNLIYRKYPDYLVEKLIPSRSTRSMNLNIPMFNHLNSSRLFFVSTIRLWNSLPTALKLITNMNAFRKSIYKYYNNTIT